MAFLRNLLAAGCVAVCGCHAESSEASTNNACSAAPAFAPVSQTLQIAGESFDIVRSGPATGPIVLLLQGFPDHSFEYRTTMPRLAAAGYQTIAAIRRSTGAALPDNTTQVLAIADALALQSFHVAGAQLAWDVARRAPERVLSVATTSKAQAAAMENLERACHRDR